VKALPNCVTEDPNISPVNRPPRDAESEILGTVVASRAQRRALGIFALASSLALLWLSLPVASGLFLGTLLAFSLLGVYERLSKWLRRPALAALGLSVASGLVILGGVVGLFSFVVARGIGAANGLAHGLDPGSPMRIMLEHVEAAARSSRLGPLDLEGRVRDAAAAAASKLALWAAAVASATFGVVLMLFFTIMATFFVLQHWTGIVERAERMLPLHPAHTHLVLAEFQKVGREVFIGTILTGLSQGFLAGVGYAIAGVSEAPLLGALTAICSLVPAIGTLLVWLPVGIALLLSGHPAAAIFVLVWGALVVGLLSDYVIRPRLVGGSGHVPTLVTFVSLFGGVQVFGLVGLIVGPVIASVALALLRTYDREVCAVARRTGEDTHEEATSAERHLAGTTPTKKEP